LARLKSAATEIALDGRIIGDPRLVKQIGALIASRKGWDLNDYSIEALSQGKDAAPSCSKQQNRSVSETTPTLDAIG